MLPLPPPSPSAPIAAGRRRGGRPASLARGADALAHLLLGDHPPIAWLTTSPCEAMKKVSGSPVTPHVRATPFDSSRMFR